MIDAKRADELMAWLTEEQISSEQAAGMVSPDDNDEGLLRIRAKMLRDAGVCADLLAILADYEAARPLIEAAVAETFEVDGVFVVTHDRGNRILEAALAYRMEQGKKEDAAQVPAYAPTDDARGLLSRFDEMMTSVPWMPGRDGDHKYFGVLTQMDVDDIRHQISLAPRRVSREWVEEWAVRLGQFFGHDGLRDTLVLMLRSIGIEVADV